MVESSGSDLAKATSIRRALLRRRQGASLQKLRIRQLVPPIGV
jgi:hypothetical protein